MSELTKFLFEGLPVRGMLVRIESGWREMLARREAAGGYPEPVRVLLGEVTAGMPVLPTVPAGTAVRIMTGAPMPPGADAVVPIEEAEEADGRVLLAEARRGAHVRAAAHDTRVGDEVLVAGELAWVRPDQAWRVRA